MIPLMISENPNSGEVKNFILPFGAIVEKNEAVKGLHPQIERALQKGCGVHIQIADRPTDYTLDIDADTFSIAGGGCQHEDLLEKAIDLSNAVKTHGESAQTRFYFMSQNYERGNTGHAELAEHIANKLRESGFVFSGIWIDGGDERYVLFERDDDKWTVTARYHMDGINLENYVVLEGNQIVVRWDRDCEDTRYLDMLKDPEQELTPLAIMLMDVRALACEEGSRELVEGFIKGINGQLTYRI